MGAFWRGLFYGALICKRYMIGTCIGVQSRSPEESPWTACSILASGVSALHLREPKTSQVASATIMVFAVHFLAWLLIPGAWLLSPGAAEVCPANYYWSPNQNCAPCADNASNPDGDGGCSACPMGKWTPPETGRRRLLCELPGCSTRRRTNTQCLYSMCSSLSSSRTGCMDILCPEGQKRREGRCLPLLAYMLEYGPTPILLARRDNYSFARLGLQVPLPAEVYENISLTASVDVAPNTSALSPDSRCSSEWTWTRIASGYNVTKAFTYPELNGPCTLGVAFNTSTGTRSGAVGVFLSRKAAPANQAPGA